LDERADPGHFGRRDAGTNGAGRDLPVLSESQSQQENTMQIQINTDHNIEGHQALSAQISGVVESALSRFRSHITRVEVHVSDVNGDKRGQNDKRCVMEARLEGRQPIVVTNQASTLDQSVDGAADKLTRLIESTLGRLHDQQSHRTDPLPSGPKLTGQS
jgi:ribosome-associated translation inhibitor RaiA